MATSPPENLTYKDSGVDISAAEAMVGHIRHLAQRTHSTRVLSKFPGGSGLFRLDYNEKLFARHYKEPVLIAATAGVGTKIKVAAELRRFDTLGIDLVALCVNDLIVHGGEPLFLQHYLALHAHDLTFTTDMIKGISDGCMEAGCALLGGETAEMPAVHAAGDFDMAGFAVGVVDRKRMLDSADIEAGDSLIGLASSGLHANGYALVRRIVEKSRAGLMDFIPELNCTLGEELLRPTRIYVKTVQKILGRYKVKKVIKAMAHITGGLPGNLPRILPPGFAARLKRDAWTPHPIFNWLQKHGPVDLDEMYGVFNMGVGFVLVVRPTFTKPIMSALRTLREKPIFLGKVRKIDDASQPRLEWS